MKALYGIRNHYKISLSLFVLILVLLVSSIIEKRYLRSIGQEFSSMYADRLVPATDIFQISDQLWEQRLGLQSYLYTPESSPMAYDPAQLTAKNHSVDSLIKKYQSTYLVKNEALCLKGFTRKWMEYKSHEQEVLRLFAAGESDQALALFNTSGNTLFKSLVADLQQLTRIQSQVGEDLMDSSKMSISSTDSMLSIQVVVVIIIGLISHALLLASRMFKQPGQNFRLN